MGQVTTARTMLRNVVDPELGLNIIDLGLVYELRVENNKCYVLMTFTTMGCPMSGSLVDGVYEALEPLGFEDVKVDVTFNPPWSPERMSNEAKERLGISG
ncbi:MAG TPA: metal-sulfur cluster assembly factor [Symbiobacteriaceae bacterium]|nr:metal-sulfur cluster assembly factor [Symbiobacteriaceae bacterium]